MASKVVQCLACMGKGEKENQFTKRFDTCRPCDGTGEVTPCDSFFSRKPAAMRNRNCEHCYATYDQHIEILVRNVVNV